MGRFLIVLMRPFLALFLMLLLQVAAGMVVMLEGVINGRTPADGAMTDGLFNVPLMSVSLIVGDVIIAIACMSIFRRRQYTRSEYVPSSATWQQNMVGLLGCVSGVVALDLMTELMSIPNLMEEQMMAICHNPWGVVAIALAAPVGEEMLFRWGIMGHLLHHNWNVYGSILFSALLFGIIHMNPAQVFFATAMGVLLGMLYWKTGNILMPILLHVLNNSVACAQVWLLGDDIHEYSIVRSIGGSGMAWATVAVCTTACIGLMWRYAVSKPAGHDATMEGREA